MVKQFTHLFKDCYPPAGIEPTQFLNCTSKIAELQVHATTPNTLRIRTTKLPTSWITTERKLLEITENLEFLECIGYISILLKIFNNLCFYIPATIHDDVINFRTYLQLAIPINSVMANQGEIREKDNSFLREIKKTFIIFKCYLFV